MYITYDGKCDKEIRRSIVKVKDTFEKLSIILRNTKFVILTNIYEGISLNVNKVITEDFHN